MILENRVAVITGATGGLGSLVAYSLAQRGVRLALFDRDFDKLDVLVKSLDLPESRMFALKVDLLNSSETKSSAEALVAKFGRIDILLHLVGGWTGEKTIVDASADDLTFMLNQHVWTSFNAVQAFIPYLIRNNWGRIIMISSPFATHPNAKGGPFAIGKSGQETMMQTLSQELMGTGVTANLLQVKRIDTKGEKHSAPSPENASWTTLDEITTSILYLLSDEAGTVNGAKIPLYGSF